MENKTFQQELAELLNKHGKERPSNTPDFILAEYLTRCLETFTFSTLSRSARYKNDKA